MQAHGEREIIKEKKRKTANLVLALLGVFIFLFISAMVVTFWVKDAVPDTLIQYTLGAGGLEALLLAGIKISKVIKGEKTKRDNYNHYNEYNHYNNYDYEESEWIPDEIDNERYY